MITLREARVKVNVLMISNVSTGLLSGTPELVESSIRSIWRVPVILALPGHGHMGQVGMVDIDAKTGEILTDQTLFDTIHKNANDLVQRTGS
jgi:hypothetical protein